MSGAETGPSVCVVNSEQWPRACLRAELIERGYDCIGYIEFAHALTALRYRPKPRVIVLELRGQSITRSEIEILHKTRIPVVISGGAAELNDPIIKKYQWAAVLQRPFTIGQVAEVVEKLLERV